MGWNFTQEADGTAELLADGNGSDQADIKVVFASGVEIELGRGDVDEDITYVACRTSDGTKAFIHANTAGNAIVVTTTKP